MGNIRHPKNLSKAQVDELIRLIYPNNDSKPGNDKGLFQLAVMQNLKEESLKTDNGRPVVESSGVKYLVDKDTTIDFTNTPFRFISRFYFNTNTYMRSEGRILWRGHFNDKTNEPFDQNDSKADYKWNFKMFVGILNRNRMVLGKTAFLAANYNTARNYFTQSFVPRGRINWELRFKFDSVKELTNGKEPVFVPGSRFIGFDPEVADPVTRQKILHREQINFDLHNRAQRLIFVPITDKRRPTFPR